MFESARIKLTFFYLAVVVLLSLILTLGTRALAQRAFDDSTSAQQGGIRNMIRRDVGLPIPDGDFDSLRDQQDSEIAHNLNEYVLYINLIAIVAGGIGSYWYAGIALRPIEEAHEAQARFASDASHELRTPLTVMKTENEVFLRQRAFDEKDARDQISSNLEEIQHLEQLTANLLSLANYEKGERLELKTIKSVDVSKLAVEQLAKLHPNSAKRVTVDVVDSKIVGHAESLAQALTIFLDNAIKYSPGDKPIKLLGLTDDEYFKFMVEDSGPGIKLEDMPQIFDRLYRGDKNRSKTVPGNGLGLSLAKEIAKANEAGLSVSNIADGGARFTLTVKQPTK
jgi:two-component system sensor histidine kinase CiaH